MTHADIVRVFTFTPISEEQETDLHDLHEAACALATTIYRTVNPQVAQQAIQSIGGVVGICRTAIETNPRQGMSRIELVTQ